MKINMRRDSVIFYSGNHRIDNATGGVFQIKLKEFNLKIVLI